MGNFVKATAFLTFALIGLISSGIYAQCNHSGLIGTNTVWANDCVHIITSDVTVDCDATLRIEPGTRVRIQQNASLIVKGTLIAVGTAAEKIYFTSTKDTTGGTPGPHDWVQLNFTNCYPAEIDDSLVYCVIRYGGGWHDYTGWHRVPVIDVNGASPYFASCYIYNNFDDVFKCFSGATPDIIDCCIHDNGGDAFYVDLTSFPDISFSGNMNDCLFNNNGNGIKVKGGLLNENAVWPDMGPCYWIDDIDLTVGNDATLTLEPGVIVKFGQNRSINVDGTLRTIGLADSLIYFTSRRDDIRQDTEGGGGTAGQVHDWNGVYINSTSSNDSLINCVVRFGGGWYDYTGWHPVAVINVSGASPYFESCYIFNNYDDVFKCFAGAIPDIIDCCIHDNGGDAYYIDLTSFPNISFSGNMNDCLFNNNGNGIKVKAGLLNESSVWRDMGPCYWINDVDLTVGNGATLTLEPGVIIKFGQNRSINVDGTLRAIGPADSMIYFTSWRDDERQDTEGGGGTVGQVHDWNGVYINSTSSNDSLINCVVRYGGGWYDYTGWHRVSVINVSGASAYFENCHIFNNYDDVFKCFAGAAPDIIDCRIHDNGGDAYYIDLTSFPNISFSGNMNDCLFNNNGNGIKVQAGLLNQDAVWRDMGPCYWINDVDLTVGNDVTLTLEPGVIVKFGQNRSLNIEGTLNAIGLPDSLVYFTSRRDDIRQDTEGGGGTVGQVHDWNKIVFNPSSANDSLVNCVIRYVGGWHDYTGWHSEPVIDINASSPVLKCCTFEYGWTKYIKTQSGAEPVIRHCSFMGDNTIIGIHNTDTTVTINAEDNYWGDPSGPYDPVDTATGPPDFNPGGLGCKVGSYVAYRPWSDESFPCGYLSTPVVISPTENPVVLDTVNFIWHKVEEAIGYELLICYDHNLADTFYHNETLLDTVHTVALASDQAFFWCIRTRGICTWSEWSEIGQITDVVGVRDNSLLPVNFSLEQNYPNPFNPSTAIDFALPRAAMVELDVYNVTGQKVSTLVSEYLTAGHKSVIWDGTNGQGEEVATGIYFYRIKADGFNSTRKMLLLK